MRIISHVAADFHDKKGELLYSLKARDRLAIIDVPDSITQDPLFQMLVNERSLDVLDTAKDIRRAEKAPEPETDASDTSEEAPAGDAAAPEEAKARKPKKAGSGS